MGALDGFKVLDFTTLLPGPYATMTLADLGAEVLKVSGRDKYDLVVNWPPVIEGAQVTGAQAWLGRNKKTIFLNLKKSLIRIQVIIPFLVSILSIMAM